VTRRCLCCGTLQTVGYGGVEIKYLSTKIFLMFYALIAPIVLAFTFDGLIHMRARMRRLQYATAVLQDKIALSEVVVDFSAAQRHREEQLRQQQALPRRHGAHNKPAGTEQQAPHRGEELVEVDLEGGTPLHFPPRANRGVKNQGHCAEIGELPNGAGPREAHTRSRPPSALSPSGGAGNRTAALTSRTARPSMDTLTMDDRDGLFSPRSQLAHADLFLPPLSPPPSGNLHFDAAVTMYRAASEVALHCTSSNLAELRF
jgi:hypothetical protein